MGNKKTPHKQIKIVSIIGARPQFIKAAPVSTLIRQKYRGRVREILVHTGQHYDQNMSGIFFREMRIPRPKYHLGVGGRSHGAMTGRMMEKIEKVLVQEKPDWVLVYGDTNSTLAGALAAVKLHIPVAHVEAGLRSFNMRMPEEINRILTDRISSLLFCPTPTAVQNLKNEGISQGVYLSGDVMMDAVRHYQVSARQIPLKRWRLREKGFVFCTVHRQENTDNRKNLRQILKALREISRQVRVVFAIHPRTKKAIHSSPGLQKLLGKNHAGTGTQKSEKNKPARSSAGIVACAPLGYLETQRMVMGARLVITDSGGLQKEAFFHKTPCIILRQETEWLEILKSGQVQVAGADTAKIMNLFSKLGKTQISLTPLKNKLEPASLKTLRILTKGRKWK